MKHQHIALSIALLLGGCHLRANTVETFDRTLPGQEIKRLFIEVDRGYLEVEGVSGQQDIDLRVDVQAPNFISREEALEDDFYMEFEDGGGGDACSLSWRTSTPGKKLHPSALRIRRLFG